MRTTFLILATLVGGYVPSKWPSQRFLVTMDALSGAISSGSAVPGGEEISEENSPVPFDLDFAEAMSKPLPEWYVSQKSEREKIMKELQENRDRIMNEFRAKYEVSDEVKRKDLVGKNKWSFLDKMNEKNQGESSKKILSGEGEGEEEGGEEGSLTTREKWEMFWKEEEKSTGFYLPGFFEVFPELQLKWPTWAKRKGEAIECERDEDCQFPQACCPHPLIPGDKFCCTGWTQRIMVPAYAKQIAATDRRTRDEAEEEEATKEAERREREGKRPWEPND